MTGVSVFPELKVNVLVSTYNGEKYLREQLDSLLAQSHKNIHISVRDDGSTDNTVRILKEYASKYRFIQVAYGENLGVIESFFRLLTDAGEDFDYFAFCDQDDIWFPDKIKDAVEEMNTEDGNQPILYCSRVEFVDENKNPLGLSRIPGRIGFGNALVENIAIGCTIVINRKARETILATKPGRIIMHDWWFYLIVSALGKVIHEKKVNIKYRQHGRNVIGGTASFLLSVYRRTREFLKSGEDAFRVRDQAIEFRRCYGQLLDDTHARILRRFIESKNTISTRVQYSLGMDVWRQSSVDTNILRVLVLFGYY